MMNQGVIFTPYLLATTAGSSTLTTNITALFVFLLVLFILSSFAIIFILVIISSPEPPVITSLAKQTEVSPDIYVAGDKVSPSVVRRCFKKLAKRGLAILRQT